MRLEFIPWRQEEWGGACPFDPMRHTRTKRVGLLARFGLLVTYGEKTMSRRVVGDVEWLDDRSRSFVPIDKLVSASAVDVLAVLEDS